MNRREFLKMAALASFGALQPGAIGWAFSNGQDNVGSKKLIVILLRGGMDGLNVIAPYGDNRYASMRPNIALSKANGMIDLDGYFGMHPSLAPILPLFREGSLAFVHAAGSPDPTRSHFDAQDYMESGMPGIKSASSGWLNRLVGRLPSKHSPLQAINIGAVLPRIYAGPASVASVDKNIKVSKSALDRPAIASGFSELYTGAGNGLGEAFKEGMAAHQSVNTILSEERPNMAGMGPGIGAGIGMDREQQIANKGAVSPAAFPSFGKQLSTLFRKDPSVQVAFVDFGGWDTHVRQGNEKGQLAGHLNPLAAGLADLVRGLGELYKDTSIVVMSEFGRTAKENGNAGTDHGHGNVMWLMGGGLPGGKVWGRFGGLSQNNLYEDRDVPATTDFRTVLSAVLGQQMELAKSDIAQIFPGFQVGGNPFVQG
jgi:uncharacterized protein (DUF1501 family)